MENRFGKNLNLARIAWRESKVSTNEREEGGKKGDETGQRNGAQDRSMCKNDSQRIHYPERN